MASSSFYFQIIRKITASFASLFSNIMLIRFEDNLQTQRIIVPLVYGDKEKYVKRLEGDPELFKKIQIQLPRMSYELVNTKYDSNRKLNTNNRDFSSDPNDPNNLFSVFNPVPYDFSFALTIYTRTVEDGNQIIEQILPFFTPDYTIRLNLIPEMGLVRNVPVILDSVQQIIDADGVFNSEVRTVMWTLSFTVKAFIFGGIKDVPAIRSVDINFITSSGLAPSTSSIGETLRELDGPCCSGSVSRGFVMLEGGCRTYKVNEVVYQGISLNNAYASGRVFDWNDINNTLLIKEVCGTFKLNQPIVGIDTLAMHVPIRNVSNTHILLRQTTTVSPNTATANSCWTANTTLEELPNFSANT